MGLELYTLPLSARHLSTGVAYRNIIGHIVTIGDFPEKYYICLRKLFKKHLAYVSRIYTTCGVWDAGLPLWIQRSIVVIKLNLLDRNFESFLKVKKFFKNMFRLNDRRESNV
jgi:hypothetical protein